MCLGQVEAFTAETVRVLNSYVEDKQLNYEY